METLKVIMEFRSGREEKPEECPSGFIITYKTLYANLDNKVCQISLGALIGYVYFPDQAREIGLAVFCDLSKNLSPFISSFPTLGRLMQLLSQIHSTFKCRGSFLTMYQIMPVPLVA